MDSDRHLAEICKESEQRIVRCNVALVGRNRADKLTCLLVAETVNVADAVFPQLGYGAVGRRR